MKLIAHRGWSAGGDENTLDAALSFLSQTDLELFVEIKETGLASVVIEKLVSSNVADRSVVFAFAAVARSFPGERARPVRLGVIVMCPWNLNRVVRAYAPDVYSAAMAAMCGWMFGGARLER